MEADDKPFACSFAGCNMRFTNEDHLTVHKKKHDMVLNLGNGQKTNVFVADQTPTPTRFIRNCEEVGLFQDLQNVNPFEETFRKAVEASKTGVGLLHEVDSLSVPTGTDDTLHTPNVFPHIAEDSTSDSSSAYKSVATPFIASACVITENGRKQPSLCSEGSTSPGTRRELDQLLHPTSTTGDVECHREIITGNIPEERRVVELSSSTKVVRQEADTSQHQETSRQVVTVNTENKNGLEVGALSPEPPAVTPSQASSSTVGNTVQLLLRMPDGKLLQLSALPVEPVTPSGANQLMQQQSQVEPQPVPTQNATVVLTTPGPTPVVTSVPDVTLEKCKNPTPAVKMSPSPIKQPTGLSLAKLRLKQTLISNNRTAATVKESIQKQSSAKVSRSEVSKAVPETHATSPASVTPARRASSSSGNEDPGEKRQKFLERNRAAAMRCREKRKTWIQELERRAEEMLATNQQLQSEVASLRKEVADLKTLLLAHKDCPVTQAMAQG
ncbi:Cyclic AMP-dependent transcription factor ATF-2 [Cryptotermes secundus]|nr:Cyclic AMP-dependent transcription factor ATF-2 [Cryptotermes secundus]